MHLYSRSDLVLIGGLTAAVFVVFSQPLSGIIEFAADVEQAWGLNLVSGLIILTVVLVLHAQGRRHESHARALAMSAEAAEAQARARELEQLIAFGSALAKSLDVTAIRNEVLRYLPPLLGRDDGWVVVRVGGHWEALVEATGAEKVAIDTHREQITDEFFRRGRAGLHEGEWVVLDEESCLPLLAAGKPMGFVGLPASGPSLTDRQKGLLAAASPVVAIAIRNADLFRELRDNSLRDGLTGCFNRAHTMDTLASELRRSYRSRHAISVVMFDLDHFKQINDQYGHQGGDEVLAAVGHRLREILRSSDIKCRYGGEEFLLVLPDTPLEGARRVADTVRRELDALKVPWGPHAITVTASVGLTTAALNELEPAAVIARADAALYKAKEDGRNCVREALPAESALTP
jgi:diguanylate cyclase (GGDEF)-like protein